LSADPPHLPSFPTRRSSDLASDIGQGVNTLLCQIAAEEMHCDPRDVTVVAADTDLTPVDLGAYSSRVTFMVGLAAREACQKLAEDRKSTRLNSSHLGISYAV